MQLGGTVLGLVGPLKIVRDYLKGYAESRKVGNQLKNALQSLNLYEDSIRASEQSGKTLYAKIDGVVLPMSLHDAEDLILLLTQFDNNFSDVLSSVVMFGKECNFLISGAVEGFMETVKTRKPEVHDLLTTFGKNYGPKTDTLNLTFLPMLLRIHGSKLGWKESHELSRVVAEGKQKLSRVREKAGAMSKQRLPRVTNRRLVFQYMRSLERMGREGKKLTVDKSAIYELTRGAPPWMIELNEIVEDVQKALPGLWKPTYRTPRVPGFKTDYPKTGHRK